MGWFFWIVFSVITTSISNLLQRVVMREKDSDPYSTAVIFQFATGILTGVFALWRGFVLPPLGQYFWNFLGGTLLWGLGSLALFKAYQTLGSSEVAIISSLGTVVTIISSILFLGESFNVPKSVGTILILGSILLVNWRKRKFSFGEGTGYALITTVFYGLAVTNDAFILRTYDAASYTSVISLLPGFLLLAIRPKAISAFKKFQDSKFTKNMLFLALFYSAQAIAYYVALQLGANASQVAPIYKANIILTVVLAVIFLNERKNLFLKFVSVILVTVGVLLIK